MKRAWVWLFVVATLVWADTTLWAGMTVWAQDTATSVGEMATTAQADILQATGLISVLFYLVGAVLVGVGLLKVKRHSDQPQQVTLGSGLMWIIIGVALIVAPFLINAVANTLGTSAGGAGPDIKPPKLN